MPDPADLFKSYSEILEVDKRYSFFTTSTGTPVTLELHYASIKNSTLSHEVDDAVLIQYEAARNTYVYAWYNYRLGMIAIQQAFAALELSLRKYLKSESDGRKNTLAQLLRRAHSQGLLRLNEIAPHLSPEDFIDSIFKMRNILAHGSSMLMPPHVMLPYLEDCAKIINQFYKNVRKKNLPQRE